MSIPPTAQGTDAEEFSPEDPSQHVRSRRLRTAALVSVVLVAGVASTSVAIVLHRSRSSVSSTPKPTVIGSSAVPGDVTDGPAGGTVAVPAGYPSASTTGVPAGTELTPYTGPQTITTNGTVIQDVLINGCLVLRADNVTIRDSKIVCRQNRAALYMEPSAVGAVVSHVEVDGDDHASVGIQVKNAVVEYVNVYDSGDGVHLGTNATLQDSFIHDLGTQPNIHHDDLQTERGSNAEHIRVLHNTLLAYTLTANDNSVYHLGSGAISDVLIEDNFIDGGQYSIEVTDSANQHDIVLRDNDFGRHYHYDIIMLGTKGSAVLQQGNVWQDNGQPATQADSDGKGDASAASTKASTAAPVASAPSSHA